MKDHGRLFRGIVCFTVLWPVLSGWAVDITASDPKGVSLAVYDEGFALVNELRSVNLAKGENNVCFRQLPETLDPSTLSFSSVGARDDFDMLEQRFEFDLATAERLFNRYVGESVKVVTTSGERTGILLSAPSVRGSKGDSSIVLQEADNPDKALFINMDDVREVQFPAAGSKAFLQPTLIWRLITPSDKLQNIRLSYMAHDMKWEAAYEALVAPAGTEAYLGARVSLINGSGGTFKDARIKLISTEKGLSTPLFQEPGKSAPVEALATPALRYPYGMESPAFERQVASLAALQTYDVSRPVDLYPGETKHIQISLVEKLPVSRFYVYDGVLFDRFQRNRRTDWNYGTESHRRVETHFQFTNSAAVGLGADLPPGRFRVFEQKDDGTVSLLGEDVLQPTPAGAMAHVLLGTARGLQGERERTGYSEITPLHEYEESFEIRLENNTSEPVEIRVVEHLYRWNEFEIVKADTEYFAAGPQTVEFHPVIKQNSKRSIHYTVRYRW